jgi:hypothetical protein
MSTGSAAGMAVGTLFSVVGLVAVVVGVVSASLALGGGRSVLVTVGPGVAAALVLCGLSMLAVGGTLLWGLR